MKFVVLLSIVGVVLSTPQAGLVGPSGVIGPSGIVSPSGPVQFPQPAWAFLGNAAHAHIASLNAHKAAHAAARRPAAVPAQFQAAPPAAVRGMDAARCLVGPSGKVCPTGNVQFT